MNLPPGAHSHKVRTKRLNVQYIESGPSDGIPVVMVHGNLSTGRFFEHLMPAAPDRYRIIAPDMRGFGDTERAPIDATRGLRDWADDTYSLVEALGISRPVHLVGWSTGGAAIANYAEDWPVASLTFIDPVSPYGFGGVRPDGTPCFPDYAGSGGGTGSPEFAQRIADGDTSVDSPFSPRNVINSSYWPASHHEPKEREDMLVAEILKSVIGDDGYPGDATPSANWPGIAPGTRGILNALSGKYCNWAGIVAIEPKPPVLWTHGTADIVVADGSAWEMGTLGKMGVVPGWPGEEVFPPQLMVTQIRTVLERYREAGGHVQMEKFEGSGHGPLFDAAERWSKLFFEFLATAEPAG
jgi:pimeloyl-ACP methyl ester carboxylesterase